MAADKSMIGRFVKSKAGHDKDQIYVIFSEDKEYVYLVDGIFKKVAKPKRKNKKHIEMLNQFLTASDIECMEKGNENSNIVIKRAIKLFHN